MNISFNMDTEPINRKKQGGVDLQMIALNDWVESITL